MEVEEERGPARWRRIWGGARWRRGLGRRWPRGGAAAMGGSVLLPFFLSYYLI
jgi:hypothetical protein